MLPLLALSGVSYCLVPVLTSRTLFSAKRTTAPHRHNVYHVVFILSGRGKMHTETQTHAFSAGDILTINPGQTHLFRGTGRDVHNFAFNYYLLPSALLENGLSLLDDRALCEKYAETRALHLLVEGYPSRVVSSPVGHWERIVAVLTEFGNGSTDGTGSGVGERAALVWQLAATRLFLGVMPYLSGIIPVDRTSPLVRKALSELRHSAHQGLKLATLARRVGCNPTYLSAQVRKLTGLTLSQHLVRLRVAEATRLLRTTTQPLARIALATGFCSQQHFSAVFKRIQGVSPRAYRTMEGRL